VLRHAADGGGWQKAGGRMSPDDPLYTEWLRDQFALFIRERGQE
jgi:hypothetical protein